MPAEPDYVQRLRHITSRPPRTHHPTFSLDDVRALLAERDDDKQFIADLKAVVALVYDREARMEAENRALVACVEAADAVVDHPDRGVSRSGISSPWYDAISDFRAARARLEEVRRGA